MFSHFQSSFQACVYMMGTYVCVKKLFILVSSFIFCLPVGSYLPPLLEAEFMTTRLLVMMTFRRFAVMHKMAGIKKAGSSGLLLAALRRKVCRICDQSFNSRSSLKAICKRTQYQGERVFSNSCLIINLLYLYTITTSPLVLQIYLS